MADSTKGTTIEIGGEKRTVYWPFGAFRAARKLYPGKTVQSLLTTIDPGTLPDIAACGFLHKDKTVTGDVVEAWLDEDPEGFAMLSVVTVKEITLGYRRMAPKGERKGEVEAAGKKIVEETLAAKKKIEENS